MPHKRHMSLDLSEKQAKKVRLSQNVTFTVKGKVMEIRGKETFGEGKSKEVISPSARIEISSVDLSLPNEIEEFDQEMEEADA